MRERVEVMDRHFVERPKVYVEAEGAIILLDKVGFRNPIVGGRNDNTFGEHIGDGSIDAIVVEGGTSACSHADGSGVPGTNDMLYRERAIVACVGWRASDGKRANNWRTEINRSLGLRATWTWLRWGTWGLSCRRGIGGACGTISL